MMQKMNESDLLTKNWYYVQVFAENKGGDYHKHLLTVCFADSTKEAMTAVKKWLAERGEEIASDEAINLYHKNYKRDSKKMVAAGNFIAFEAAPSIVAAEEGDCIDPFCPVHG